ncbi:hypothetical protein PWT90_01386 [Aphanocladium album]|nr:hypothetical protein PWT90_01386 [Aphanocladium album]
MKNKVRLSWRMGLHKFKYSLLAAQPSAQHHRVARILTSLRACVLTCRNCRIYESAARDHDPEVHLGTRRRQQDLGAVHGSEARAAELKSPATIPTRGSDQGNLENVGQYTSEDIEILASLLHTPAATTQSLSVAAHARRFITLVPAPNPETTKTEAPSVSPPARQTAKPAPPPQQKPPPAQEPSQQQQSPRPQPEPSQQSQPLPKPAQSQQPAPLPPQVPPSPAGASAAPSPQQSSSSRQPPPPPAPAPTSQSSGATQSPEQSDAPRGGQSSQPTRVISTSTLETSVASLTEPTQSAEKQPDAGPMPVSPPRKLSRGAEAGIVIGSKQESGSTEIHIQAISAKRVFNESDASGIVRYTIAARGTSFCDGREPVPKT